jgi:hypothetical protein
LFAKKSIILKNLKPNDFMEKVDKIYALLHELHISYREIFINRFSQIMPLIDDQKSYSISNSNDFWKTDNMFIEPIFYGDTGAFFFSSRILLGQNTNTICNGWPIKNHLILILRLIL